MFKNVKLLSWISLLLLILALSLSSYAWYQAKVNNDNVAEITSDTLDLSLQSEPTVNLKPYILNEGVINNTNTLPSDWDLTDPKYGTLGTEVTFTYNLKVNISQDHDFKISFIINYYDELKNKVEVADISNFIITYNTTEYQNNSDVLNITKEQKDLVLTVSVKYSKPDELLPLALINSDYLSLEVNLTY